MKNTLFLLTHYDPGGKQSGCCCFGVFFSLAQTSLMTQSGAPSVRGRERRVCCGNAGHHYLRLPAPESTPAPACCDPSPVVEFMFMYVLVRGD